MGLFDNIRQEILEEFSSYTGASNFKYETLDKNGDRTCYVFNRTTEPINSKKTNSLVQLLEDKRWGYDTTCVRCHSDNVYIMVDDTYRCGKCKSSFTVFTDTLLSGSKVSINVHYDTVALYRENNNITSTYLAKHFNLTQKTMYYILSKIKLNALAKEKDIPILSVLLQPSRTIKRLPKKKLPFDQWERECIKKLRTIYVGKNERYFSIIAPLFFILREKYNKSCKDLSYDLGVSKEMLSRYLNGERSIKKIHPHIVSFLNKEIIGIHKKQSELIQSVLT